MKNNVTSVHKVIKQTRATHKTKFPTGKEVDLMYKIHNGHLTPAEWNTELLDLCQERLEKFVSTKTFQPNKFEYLPFTFAKREKLVAQIAQFSENLSVDEIMLELNNIASKLGVEGNDQEVQRSFIRELNGRMYWVSITNDERKGVR